MQVAVQLRDSESGGELQGKRVYGHKGGKLVFLPLCREMSPVEMRIGGSSSQPCIAHIPWPSAMHAGLLLAQV